MKEDIYKFVRSCDACQCKRPHPLSREHLLPVLTGAVFSKVFLDLSGSYHQTSCGNKYILCFIDHFSKFVIATAIPGCTAVRVAHAIMTHCILVFGAMTELVSDNALYLRSDLLAELGRLFQIDRYFNTPYHHEGNGACERMFAAFQAMLRTYTSTTRSPTGICSFSRAHWLTTLRSTVALTTLPFSLCWAVTQALASRLIRHKAEGQVPTDSDASIYKESLVTTLQKVWMAASAYNAKRSTEMKRSYERASLPPSPIRVGDRVYLRDLAPEPGLSAKLYYLWLGQFRVISVEHPTPLL